MTNRERNHDPIRVVVCDDYFLIREGLKAVLGQLPDIEVVAEAEDGEEVVRLVDELLPDVIVIDVAMPGMDGIEATRRIKHSHPGVAAIVLTRYDDTDHITEIYRSGASAYLAKSVMADELARTVRAVHEGSIVLHPQAAGAVFLSFREASPSALCPAHCGLSPREVDVLRLVAQGNSNKEIARELGISLRTAQNHLGNIFRKLGLNDRVSASVYAISEGIASLEEAALRGAPARQGAAGEGGPVRYLDRVSQGRLALAQTR